MGSHTPNEHSAAPLARAGEARQAGRGGRPMYAFGHNHNSFQFAICQGPGLGSSVNANKGIGRDQEAGIFVQARSIQENDRLLATTRQQ